MSMQILGLVFGLISLILALLISIPQLIQLKKTRNSSGVSLWSYIIFNASSIIWLLWAFLFYFNALATEPNPTKLFQWTLLPAMIMDIANVFVMMYILVVKVKYMNLAKQLKVSELQLSKILLDEDKKKYFNTKTNKISIKKYLGLIIYLLLMVVTIVTVTTIISIFGLVKIESAKNWRVLIIVINAIAAISWEAISWPQFIKSLKVKDTTGISLFWAIFLPTSNAVMFVYDLYLLLHTSGSENNYGIIFSLIFNGLIPSIGVLILKIINITKAKKYHMTEKEYTIKYLAGK